MNNMLTVFLIAGMAVSCSSSQPAINYYSQTDGKSYETAIFVNERSERKGIDAEYIWIWQHRSDYKVVGQSLSHRNGKHFDIISIQFADSSKEEIYFDISRFFGHP